MRIKLYHIKLKADKPELLNANLAYKLYGVLCENISSEYAARLHEQKQFRPISQRLYINHRDSTAKWEVALFDTACEEFAKALEQNEFHIRDMNINLTTLLRETAEYNTESLVELAKISAEAAKKTDLYFSTPIAFKQNGDYVMFPSVELLLKNLMEKWSIFDDSIDLRDEDALKMLLSGIKITSYKLQSNYYRMKNVSIPAFTGKITLSAKLSQPLLEVYSLLLEFSALSGIGIKTALGMGGIRIDKRYHKITKGE